MELAIVLVFGGLCFLLGMIVDEVINREKFKGLIQMSNEAYETYQAVTDVMKKNAEKKDLYIRALEENLKIRDSAKGVKNDEQGIVKGN